MMEWTNWTIGINFSSAQSLAVRYVHLSDKHNACR